MLTDFMDNIVALGAEALLPHNLSDTWLAPISLASARFLRHVVCEVSANHGTPPLDLFEDMEGSLFLAAVTEILQSRYDYPAHFQMESLPQEILFESMACYALYVTLENLARNQGISYPHPDADTLLETDRIQEIESENPDLSRLLHESFSSGEKGD